MSADRRPQCERKRGVEFLMGYYGLLDRAPKGRDEGDGFQLWIRRHDDDNEPGITARTEGAKR